MRLYSVCGYVTLRFFNDNKEVGIVRDRNSTEDRELRIVAEDVETAIQKYKTTVNDRGTKKDSDDYGGYFQSVAKISIQKVTTVEWVDVL